MNASPAGWMARGEHELPPDESWLSPHEAARARAMRFTKRRTEYLLRRWTGKQAVAAAAGLPTELGALARVEIANRPTGAPVVRLDGAATDLAISLTDRAGWAVGLVGAAGAAAFRVGCDLEIVEPRSAGFVADFLTGAEQRLVASRLESERDAVANLLWSAKESALKVLQTGLRRDTRSVEVSIGAPRDDGWGPLDLRAAEGTLMPGWWRRDGMFVLTVAAERPFPPPALLPGSADLRAARPVHSWVAQPLAP